MKLRSLHVLAFALCCSCSRESVAAGDDPALLQQRLIQDQYSYGGQRGFFFLPPISPSLPLFPGVFEARLAPVVRVDRIDAQGQTLETVAEFTGALNALGERLLRDLNREFYVARFRSAAVALDPAADYRIRVFADQAGPELGFADLDVVSSTLSSWFVDRLNYVPLVVGGTLFIHFRIEKSAVDADEDGVFDWNDNCPDLPNPAVRVSDPAAALPEEQALDPLVAEQADADQDGIGDACDCPVGYDGVPSTGCTDIDECLTAADSCSVLVSCDNIPGSYRCAPCPAGYTGDGHSCEDIDECATGHGGCSSLVACDNLPGTYACAACPAGYAGDGRVCEDIDECAMNNGGCGRDRCENEIGGVQCVPVPPRIVALASGSGADHTCALVNDGRVFCWGANADGQLGDGSYDTRGTPTQVPGLHDVTKITTGARRTCALLADAQLRCWGNNAHGELGDGSLQPSAAPIAVSTLQEVSAVASGDSHTCAVSLGGEVRCWGDNLYGELGDGSTLMRLTPSLVPGLEQVTELAAGQYHTCARQTSGQLSCWGAEPFSRMGAVTTVLVSPTTIAELADVVQVTAGEQHSCALVASGQVSCWGSNPYGTGDGTSLPRATPKRVSGLTNVTSIAAGSFHTCAALSGGQAACWGRNMFGSLGDGTTETRLSPMVIPALRDVIQLVAGRAHSCALRATGEVSCWGDNLLGQIGDRTLTIHQSPKSITFPL